MIGSRSDIWRQRLWVWASPLAFVAMGTIGLLVYQVAYSNRVKTLELDLRDQRRQLADAHAARLHGADLMRQARVNRERIVQLYDEHFSTRRRRLTGVTAEVKDLAKRAGLVPRSISYPEEQIQQYGLIKRSFVFSVEGTYADLRKFVNLLELSDSFLTLEDAALNEEGRARPGFPAAAAPALPALPAGGAAPRPGAPSAPGAPAAYPGLPALSASGAGPPGSLRMGLTISTLFAEKEQPRDALAPLPGAKPAAAAAPPPRGGRAQ
jgi:Tfp pilus assembly protein PilO